MARSDYVLSFNKHNAPTGHNGTILAGAVLPGGWPAPFETAWGYLEGQSVMEGHAHPTREIYTVFAGRGFCHVNGERLAVSPGDVALIPPNAWHTMECEAGGELLWAAFWWPEEA